MSSFFKYLFATILGVILTIVIIIATIFVVFSSKMSSSEEDAKVKENSILKISLTSPISDRGVDNPLQSLDLPIGETSSAGLKDILKNIDKAKTDDNIKGIYMDMNALTAGFATVQEIRNALLAFKKDSPEKFIIAYADNYSQKAYYLATAADSIFGNPEGGFAIAGLSAQVMFFKTALEKLGVEAQIIRHGKFKSAIEPFMLDSMSKANRLQVETYLGSIWTNILQQISNRRNVSVDDLNMYADKMLITNPKAGVKYRLLDATKYKDEIIALLKNLSGIEEKEDLRLVSMSTYTNVPKSKKDKKKKKGLIKDRIAVIYATGEIKMGAGSDTEIGSENISQAVRKARLDEDVKAIVLRVNSPGGSATASDIILREVALAADIKPVIVSMGDVAASGGYYIACAAHTILAQPNTITGSIGVFGMIPNARELLNEKLGVNVSVVNTNSHSDMGSILRQLTNEERAIIQNEIENIYDVFIGHVAKGRSLTKARVDSIGQGRVWSGSNAKEIGLIDEFGGLEKAIEIAAQKAAVDDYKLMELPEREVNEFLQMLESIADDNNGDAMMRQLTGDSYKYFKNIEFLKIARGYQARIPYFIDIYDTQINK